MTLPSALSDLLMFLACQSIKTVLPRSTRNSLSYQHQDHTSVSMCFLALVLDRRSLPAKSMRFSLAVVIVPFAVSRAWPTGRVSSVYTDMPDVKLCAGIPRSKW